MLLGNDNLNTVSGRHVLKTLENGMEVAVQLLSGKQRDGLVTILADLRNKLPPEVVAALNTSDKVSHETANRLGVSLETLDGLSLYKRTLIAYAILDGAKLPAHVQLFATPDDVAIADFRLTDQLETIAAEVNGLGNKEEERIRADFTDTRKDASGSNSPVA